MDADVTYRLHRFTPFVIEIPQSQDGGQQDYLFGHFFVLRGSILHCPDLSMGGGRSCSDIRYRWHDYKVGEQEDKETRRCLSIPVSSSRSDALGHVFAAIGRDWTHLGVAKLYTDICNNGYKIMYLTSRAIGQADSTRDYLKGISQGSYQLPEGPVIMSPDRLFTSLHR